MKLVNINKSYNENTIFNNFSLDINENEILCILGPSGAGKTTLFNIIANLVDFEGDIIDKPNNISYIFQEPRLLKHLTIKDNLKYIGIGEDKINEILKDVEMENCIDKRPFELSGGEKQRVSIARAFCNNFDLLLMDEPFSSLDTALKVKLERVFSTLWEKNKKTTIYVTHDLDEALSLAHRIIILNNGEIVLDKKINRDDGEMPYKIDNSLREELLDVLLNLKR